MKKKVSLMVVVILVLQILLPMLTVIWESGFTIKSVAAETLETTVDGIVWTYTLDGANNAIDVKPKSEYGLPQKVTIPSTLDEHIVTSIGSYAFSHFSRLTSITIPSGVTSIGDSAFYGCSSLTSIEIPEGVTSIGSYAFSSCSSLTSINVNENNQNYSSVDGVLFDKDKTALIAHPAGKKDTKYVIPNSVTNIGNYAFYECRNLTSIEIPEGVTSIGDSAFYFCSLKSITIPNSVTNIGIYAFSKCSSLTSITIPNSVTNIGNYAFYECRNLTSIEIPEGVTSIGDSAFSYCSRLTSITIPEGVTSIGVHAFEYCRSLTSITIPNSVTSIEGSAFYGCSSLTSITIPNSVTRIGNDAFSGCSSLTSIEILEGVTSIGSYAFSSCSSLTSITIPNSVTSIGYFAFKRCSSLTSINVNENNQTYSSVDGVLFNKYKTALIVHPEGKTDTKYVIPEGVTSIAYYAFYGCSSLTSIEIPSGVTSIGEEAFSGCSSLTSIEIPIGVTSILLGTFYNCSSLTSITIPNSVTSIVDGAFSGCSSLTIYCRSNSYAKTYAETNSISYIIDDEAPAITSIEGNPEDWTKENVTLTINAEDTLSGLATEAYSFDGGATWQAENTKTYEENTNDIIIKVRDSLGNIVTQTVSITKIDKEAPTITSIEGNPEEWTKENVTLTINAEDTLSGLATEAYSFDGGATWQAENTKTYEENTNDIIIKVRDSLGNIVTQTVSITKIDKEAPTITSIEGNPEDWTKENVTLTINAEDTLSGLATEAYSFDGGATWQAENTKTYEENTNDIIIKVRDNLGNIATQTVSITKIDKEAPTITSIEGNPEDWTKENVTLTINAEDTLSGLATEAYSFDGGATWQAENTKTYTENTNGIVVKVRDNLGNIKTYEEEINITKIVELESIQVKTMPNKISYYEGEKLNTEGLVLLLTYNNGTTEEIMNGFSYTPETLNTVGNQEIVVAYRNKTARFSVEVKAKTQPDPDPEKLLKGDVNGDGKVDFKDILLINKHRLNKTQLTGKYLEAAEVNGDSKVDFMDILMINKYRLGKINSL